MNDTQIANKLSFLGRCIPSSDAFVEQILERIGQLDAARGEPGVRVPAAGAGRPWLTRVLSIRRPSKFAAAALLALAVAGAFLITTRSGGRAFAFADVVERVRHAQTLSATIVMKGGDGSEGRSRIFIKGPIMRMEQEGVDYSVWNKESGRSISVSLVRKDAVLIQLAEQPLDFYGWLRDYRNGQEKAIGEEQIDGRRMRGFRVVREIPGTPPEQSTWTFWIDPDTQLPARIEIRMPGKGAPGEVLSVLTDLRFDVPLDDRLFDMTVPPGYRVQDMGGISSKQLASRPTTRESVDLVLKPGVGIGALKFGATSEQVIAALGKPEEIQRGIDLRYPSRGFAVGVSPRSGLFSINAFTKAGVGPFAVNDFAGQIDKGIAMGATRQQIEAAYGKLDAKDVTQAGPQTALHYGDLEVTFTLVNDRLVQVFLLHRPAK